MTSTWSTGEKVERFSSHLVVLNHRELKWDLVVECPACAGPRYNSQHLSPLPSQEKTRGWYDYLFFKTRKVCGV